MIEERIFIKGKPIEEASRDDLVETIRFANKLLKDYDERMTAFKAEVAELKHKNKLLRRRLNK